MDMMASESPEYTEEGPEELLDPGEDTGDSDGQTDVGRKPCEPPR